MRSTKQVEIIRKRAAIANELMLWMMAHLETKDRYSYPVVDRFAREKNLKLFECWKAWELLKAGHRLNQDQRPGWELLNSTRIEIDDKGEIAGPLDGRL